MKDKIWAWVSGLWGGVFVGALVACPAKEVSLPTTVILSAVFAYLARR